MLSARPARSGIGQHVAGLHRVVQGDWRYLKEKNGVVISRNTVRIQFPATKTLVNQHFLAIAARMDADRLHQCVAGGLSVTGHLAIDMFCVEAVWAVVALASATDWCPNELPAMPTLECLIRCRSGRSQDFLLALGAFRLDTSILASRLPLICGKTVARQQIKGIVVEVEVSGSHVHVLRTGCMRRGDRHSLAAALPRVVGTRGNPEGLL